MIPRPWPPGPWTVIEAVPVAGIGPMRDVKAGPYSIACCLAPATAHLIAAAPDLYEALNALVENFTDAFGACDACSTLGWDHQDWCLIPPSIAAIAKATGGAS